MDVIGNFVYIILHGFDDWYCIFSYSRQSDYRWTKAVRFRQIVLFKKATILKCRKVSVQGAFVDTSSCFKLS